MRTIDAAALRKAVNDFFDNSFKGIVSSDLIKYAEAVDELIDNAPTIDSLDLDVHIGGRCCGKRQRLLDELRPKGKWLEDSGNIACTHCHTIWLYRKTDYCPNCGADMRSVDEGLHERAVSDLSKTVDDLYKKLRGDV